MNINYYQEEDHTIEFSAEVVNAARSDLDNTIRTVMEIATDPIIPYEQRLLLITELDKVMSMGKHMFQIGPMMVDVKQDKTKLWTMEKAHKWCELIMETNRNMILKLNMVYTTKMDIEWRIYNVVHLLKVIGTPTKLKLEFRIYELPLKQTRHYLTAMVRLLNDVLMNVKLV